MKFFIMLKKKLLVVLGSCFIIFTFHFSSVYGNAVLLNNLNLPYDAAVRKISEVLEKNNNITILDISGNNLGTAGLKKLSDLITGLPRLTSLILSSNALKGESLAKIDFQLLNNLRILKVANNEVGSDDCKSLLRVLNSLGALQELDVSANKLKASNLQNLLNDKLFGAVKEKLKNVKVLDLSNNCLGDNFSEDLSQFLKAFTGLEKLFLNESRDLTVRGLCNIALSFRGLSSLQELHLAKSNMDDLGLWELSVGIRSLCKLKTFNVSDNKISGIDFANWGGPLKELKLLQALNLTGNPIGVVLKQPLKDYFAPLKVELSESDLGESSELQVRDEDAVALGGPSQSSKGVSEVRTNHALDESVKADQLKAVEAAVRGKNWEGLRKLLEQDEPNGEQNNKKKQTALHLAAKIGCCETLEFLLTQIEKLGANLSDESGRTALHIAVENRQFESVEMLIERADVNHADKSGSTALHLAAENFDSKIVELLLKSGANIDACDRKNRTALYRAVEYDPDCSHLDSSELDGFDCKRLEVVRALLMHKPNVIQKSRGGSTAQQIAEDKRRIAIIKEIENSVKMANMVLGAPHLSLLHRAAAGGDADAVRGLILRGVNVNLRIPPLNATALFGAVEHNHAQVVRLLLENGADVNLAIEDGHTPLFVAASNKKLGMVDLLLKFKADVDLATHEQETPLQAAAEAGDLGIVTRLLGQGASVDKERKNAMTPLHLAAQNGHLEVVKRLIEKNANINFPMEDGVTALYLAVQNNHIKIVEVLLAHGAKCDLFTVHGVSAFHIAATMGQIEMVSVFFDKRFNKSGLSKQDIKYGLGAAVRNGQYQVIQYLLKKNIDLNEPVDDDGLTVLHMAAKRADVKALELLLENGARCDLANNDGLTALHWLADADCSDGIRLLLARGAQVDAVDKYNCTALCCAANAGRLENVEILLENKANCNFNTSAGITAMHRAADNGHAEVVKLLLQRGSQYDCSTDKVLTPLCYAVRSAHLPVVKILLETNLDVNAESLDGDKITALHLAAKSGNVEIMLALLNKGANVDKVSSSGLSAVHFAVNGDHCEAIKLLWFVRRDAINLITDKGGYFPLLIAVQKGFHESLKVLLLLGANPNQSRPGDGRTPLLIAAQKGDLMMVEFLLIAGADVNQRDERGWSPLSEALTSGHKDIVDFLLDEKWGAVLENTDGKGNTPLCLAVKRRSVNMVEALLKRGANVNQPAADGQTPLSLAVTMNQFEIVSLVLKCNADVNQFVFGYTPLCLAAKMNRLETVRLLLQNGADILFKTDNESECSRLREKSAEQVVEIVLKVRKPEGYSP